MTFLFTDIEGSTALVRRVGPDVYAEIIEHHNRLVRQALLDHGGEEQGVRGDSFFAVFSSPSAGVAAALEIQRTLSQFAWPKDEHVRVRMGIHAGEVSATSSGLIGYEIHKAARIADVGYGGQILLSSAAAGLVEDWLDDGVALRSLGAHRLKDLGRAETIFQLVAEDLRRDFAPLRSLDSPDMPNNLPASLSPFVGRVGEIADVKTLVQASRMVTLTGAGGSGKTRLALQAAAEMLDGSGEGVWLVELAQVSDGSRVPSAILDALRAVPDASGPELDALVAVLKDQYLLLVLDNCEHLLEDVSHLCDRVGRHCPRVHLLVTSREPLGVDGEEVYRVRSMSLPEAGPVSADHVRESDSARLFVARAQSHDKAFDLVDENAELVASICRRLGGIPLAIELAAARLSTMALSDLHERLDQRFALLTGGSRNALPRQQTLAATVAWSYDLLSEPERATLRRLAVFVDGFDLESAESVCAGGDVAETAVADILGSLVAKSLVDCERGPTYLRYRLLETIRQYAADQLVQVDGADAIRAARRRHADYFLSFAERAQPFIRGGEEQLAWLGRVEREWENIRAAADHFDADPHGGVRLLRLTVALGYVIAGRDGVPFTAMVDRALDSGEDVPPGLRARALVFRERWNLTTTWVLGPTAERTRRSYASTMEALELARGLGDVALEAWTSAWVGQSLQMLNERDRARAYDEKALELARASGDDALVASTLLLIAWHYDQADEMGDRRRCFEAAAHHARRVQNLLWESMALFGIAMSRDVATREDAKKALADHVEIARLAELVGDLQLQTYVMLNTGAYHTMIGDFDVAVSITRRGVALARRLGWGGERLSYALFALGCTAAARGLPELAATLLGAFDRVESRLGRSSLHWSSLELEQSEQTRGDLRRALGDDEYARAMAEGAELSFDQALAMAFTALASPR